MNFDIQNIVMYFILPAVVTMGTYIVKSLLSRIETLEAKMQSATTEPQVRQLLKDRYDPLAEDIREIKEMQKKLMDLYIESIQRSKSND